MAAVPPPLPGKRMPDARNALMTKFGECEGCTVAADAATAANGALDLLDADGKVRLPLCLVAV